MLGEIIDINNDGEYLSVNFEWNSNCWGLVYLSYKFPWEYVDVFNENERTLEMMEPKIGDEDSLILYVDISRIPVSGNIDFEFCAIGENWGESYKYYFTLPIKSITDIPIPEGFEVTKRLHKSLICQWNEVEMEGYDICYVVSLSGDGEDLEQTTDVNSMEYNNELTPGKAYNIYLRVEAERYSNIPYNPGAAYGSEFPYYEYIIGENHYGWPITINPSRPYISALGVVENRINFAWELEDPDTNISEVVIELYSSDGRFLDEIADCSGDWYGKGSFEADGDGNYYILISANLNVNGTVLWALKDNGQKYYYKTDIITVSNKKFFSWHNYNVNGHDNFLESGSRVRYLTKDAWNGLLDFMERNCYVEDFAIPNDSNVYGDCANENYDVAINMCKMGENEGLLTSQIFNTVNYLVENMFGSAGIGLQYSKNPKYPVYASYFWDIQNTINENL